MLFGPIWKLLHKLAKWLPSKNQRTIKKEIYLDAAKNFTWVEHSMDIIPDVLLIVYELNFLDESDKN